MKISVVVPNLNGDRFLSETLESLIREKRHGVDLQIVVMDGGSTDNSVSIIRHYEEHIHYWESKPDSGQTAALNNGFSKTDGEIMAWLCSDDLLVAGALKKVLSYFEKSKLEVVYGDLYLIDERGRVYRNQKEIDFDLDIFLWARNFIWQPATFWRRSIWERVGGLDPNFVCAMDRDLWFKFYKAGGRFGHLHEPLAAMRMHPIQKTQRLAKLSAQEDLRAKEYFLGRSVPFYERVMKGAFHKVRRIAKRGARGAYWAQLPSPGPAGTLPTQE